MQIVALFPFFWSLYLIERRGVVDAFLYSYIPVLLLISSDYYLHIEGFPDISFHLAAFVPVMACALARYGYRYRPIFLDLIVVTFALWEIMAEWCCKSDPSSVYWATRAAFLGGVFSIAGPYFVARLLVGTKHLPVERFIKVFVFFGFLNIFTTLHCLLFDFSLEDRLLRYLFPGQSHAMWFNWRFGLPRLPAFLPHSILAGLFFAIVYRLNRWLVWNKLWEARFRHPWMRWVKKGSLISAALLFMLFLGLSRGPWLAAFIGAVIATASLRTRVRTSLVVYTLVVVVGLYIGQGLLEWYVTKGPSTSLQNSAKYRWVLVERMRGFVEERPIFGWGRESPIDSSSYLSSVDNAYLYYAIRRGKVGLTLFVLLLGWQAFISFYRAFLVARKGRGGGPSLEITLFSIQVIIIVCLGTVWVDPHSLQIYMVLGGMLGTVTSTKRSHRPGVLKANIKQKFRPSLAT